MIKYVEEIKTKNNYTAYIFHHTVLDTNYIRNWLTGHIEIPQEYVNLFIDKDIEHLFIIHGGITFNDYFSLKLDKCIYLVGFDCFHHIDDIENPKDVDFVIEELDYLSVQIDDYVKKIYLLKESGLKYT